MPAHEPSPQRTKVVQAGGWALLVIGLVLVPGPTVRVGDSQLTASSLCGAVVGLTGLAVLLFARRDGG